MPHLTKAHFMFDDNNAREFAALIEEKQREMSQK